MSLAGLLSDGEMTLCNIREASAKWVKNRMIKRPQNEAVRPITTKNLMFLQGCHSGWL